MKMQQFLEFKKQIFAVFITDVYIVVHHKLESQEIKTISISSTKSSTLSFVSLFILRVCMKLGEKGLGQGQTYYFLDWVHKGT